MKSHHAREEFVATLFTGAALILAAILSSFLFGREYAPTISLYLSIIILVVVIPSLVYDLVRWRRLVQKEKSARK